MTTCSECKYYHNEFCYGMPPATKIWRDTDTDIAFGSFRPYVTQDAPACSLFTPKSHFSDLVATR